MELSFAKHQCKASLGHSASGVPELNSPDPSLHSPNSIVYRNYVIIGDYFVDFVGVIWGLYKVTWGYQPISGESCGKASGK